MEKCPLEFRNLKCILLYFQKISYDKNSFKAFMCIMYIY